MKKILITTPVYPPEIGGSASYSAGLEKELSLLGYNVEVLCFSVFKKYPTGVRHFLFFLKIFKKLFFCDVVLVLDTFSVAFPSSVASFLLRKKMIIRVGGDFVWEQYVERTKEKILLSKFYISNKKLSKKETVILLLQKKIIFPVCMKVVFSTEWQNVIYKDFFSIKKNKIAIINNCTHPYEKQKRINAEKKTHFFCMFRNTEIKNIFNLKKGFFLAKKKFPKIKLDIYCEVNKDVFLKKNNIKAVIIPSLSEVSPNIALESLSLGIPVILTRDCGMFNDLDGRGVVWVDPLSAKDFSKKISKLMEKTFYLKKQEEIEKNWTNVKKRTYKEVALDFKKIIES
jgi:glycosyltransferase involved in cell wall biosynthesis